MKKIIYLVIFVFVLNINIQAQEEFDYVTVNSVVKKIKNKFGEVECYQANFKLISEKMGKKSTQTGVIKTLYPDRIKIHFWSPRGQKIVSDGETMWVYIPSLNVVAEQDLDHKSHSIFASNSKKGLERLFAKYHYKFASKEQPKMESDGKKYYILKLKQRESRSGFRNFTLWINENYFITRAVGNTSSGKKIDIKFTKINTKQKFNKGDFKFNIPSNARVIKNPMISEE